MTRYLKRWRALALACLASLAVVAALAAPAGAKTVCPPGTHNPAYCSHIITVSVKIEIHKFDIKIIIKVTDPHVTVTLRHNGKVIKTLYNKDVSGTFHIPPFQMPRKAGVYWLRTVASAYGTTRVETKKLVVTNKGVHVVNKTAKHAKHHAKKHVKQHHKPKNEESGEIPGRPDPV